MATVEASRHEARSTRVRSSMMLWRAMAFTSGPTVAYSTAHSKEARSMVKAPTCGPKDRSMRENSNMMNAAEMALCTTRMVKSTKACGKTGRSMDRVPTLGRMAPSTSSATLRASRMALAPWITIKSASNRSSRTMHLLGRKLASGKKCLCIESSQFSFKMMEQF